MACNGDHDMVETSRDRGDCVDDPQTGRQRKITIHKACSRDDCSATGVAFEWESC